MKADLYGHAGLRLFQLMPEEPIVSSAIQVYPSACAPKCELPLGLTIRLHARCWILHNIEKQVLEPAAQVSRGRLVCIPDTFQLLDGHQLIRLRWQACASCSTTSHLDLSPGKLCWIAVGPVKTFLSYQRLPAEALVHNGLL